MNNLGIAYEGVTVLQDKDGATAARIVSGENSYVAKCFQKDGHKREMENYRLLDSLGIPTIRVISAIDSALLLEDIACIKEKAGTPNAHTWELLEQHFDAIMSEKAKEAFLEEYGAFDLAEKALDDIHRKIKSLRRFL